MATLCAVAMLRYVDPIIIGSWAGYLLIICLWTFTQVDRRKMIMRAFREGHFSNPVHHYALMGAVAWAAPFWFTGLRPDIVHSLSVWAIALFVMMMFATLAHSLTLACILFIVPVTISAAAALALSSMPYLAAIPLLSGAFLITLCLRYAQNHVRIRVAEEGLRDNRETVSLLLREFETSADWLWQTDARHCLEQVSTRFASAVGANSTLIDGMPFLPILNGGNEHLDHLPDDLRAMQSLMDKQKSFANFTVAVTIAGEKKWWQFSAAPRRDEMDQFIGYRGVGSDVTQQHNNAEHIARLARVDALTSLPNRLSLCENLEAALQECSAENLRCALLMIDLDRFKSVNDTLGHPTGDKLLAQVAERLQALMDDKTSCGRLGGDEFAVLMRHLPDLAAAEALGHRIIDAISRPYDVNGHQLFVGASVGFAIGVQDGSTVEALIRNADLALYKSKDRGGNQVAAYVPMLHAQAEERLVMEQELRGALDRREFQIFYQPVVNAKNDALIGFEALLRWNSAKLGSVSPVRFIPVAEESRLIAPIGEWVLRMACHEAMSWPGQLKVAVNVSPEQLTDPEFTSIVESALAQSGLPPHRLEIEVTESVFMRDGGAAVQILDQLLAIGIHLSLDDFGTGYSALGYLRKARFSTIKIDRSFVSSATKGSMESIAIIRAIVALADGLGISTTAEGVETQPEVDAIRALGCRHIQGYHYGRPMTPAAIRTLLPIPEEKTSNCGR
jgi:diguanylate cyclase (GGDEF)-like protein